ncbi:MAG: hypothetical protein ACE5E1_04915, partial [Phycisphaerae bacterium]
NGAACTTCHPHDAGFLPTGGDCTACHASPQDNGDNVPPGGRRAVVGEFPVDNTHAHYGATLTNDACTTCHDMTTHMDGYVDLVDPDDGSLYTFVKPEDLASDPDVSNFCMGCHDADGAARLADPFDPFGGGNAAPDVATRLQGTLQWDQEYGDFCFGTEGTLRPVNSHHDISDADQAFSGAKLECLNCHGAHTAAASQPVSDPFDTHTPWTGTSRDFCLACHAGGSGPVDPGFPLGVMGPVIDVNDPRWVDLGVDWCKILDGACQTGDCSALRGLDSCEYGEAPWYVDYSWQHSAHGPNSKRGWADYSGAPSADLDCQVCHDPHGSYSATNPAGNPYMIRDFVDGTAFVDDGYRVGANWTGPPWDTFGIAREVMVSVSGLDVGWGAAEGLCAVCHADWLSAQHFHDFCTGCQTCHGHGMAWGEYDWGSGNDDDTPCPFNDACGRAAQLTPGVGAIGDNTIAKDSNAPFCGTDSPLNGLWYWVVGTGNTLTVTTCLPGTTFDTRLQVFCDCQTLDCIGGNDDDAACGSSGTSSTVSWCSDPDQIYYIHVGSAGPAAGVFELMVSDNGVPCGTAAVCQPEIGACCVNQVTVANNTRAECDALGGTWYVGEDCASFACPTTPSPMFEDAVEDSRSMSNGQNTGRSTSVPGDRPRPPLHFGKRP